ncbi:MAG: hypothetical protein QOE68_1192, partial [Thermoanaerobaculia bacterium]|nr:hypothetical protein [Thermoanaerobaculia bacterium]
LGEPWKTFFDPPTLARDLRQIGFSSVEDFGADALNARYFAGRTDKLRVGGSGRMLLARVAPGD